LFQVRKTTTDNGANFVKAFAAHGVESSTTTPPAELPVAESVEVQDEEEEDEEENEDELEAVDIAEILTQGPTDDENDDGATFLPEHQRCASHTLNLVASKDALTASSNAAYQTACTALMRKLKKLRKSQNQSQQAADKIFDAIGVYLKTVNDTRWNAEFDANKQAS